MVSKAQREAAKRYNDRNVRRVTVVFSPLDRDIQEYLESKGSMGGYLKGLLREDFERNGGDTGRTMPPCRGRSSQSTR